jgi:predicted acetyltransferase
MDIRHLCIEDKAAHRSIMQEAFVGGYSPEGDDEGLFPSDFEQANWLGVFDKSTLAATLGVYRVNLHWGDTKVPMGAVSNVACRADYRNQGLAGRLIKHALIEMKFNGQFLSGLCPFSYSYYRKHGWDWIGEKNVSVFPLNKIPLFDAPGYRSRLYENTEAIPYVRDVYDAYAKRFRGMFDRNGSDYPDFWRARLGKNHDRITYTVVCEEKKTKQTGGYFVFSFPKDGDTIELKDFIANSPDAYKALLNVIGAYSTQMKKVKWTVPLEAPLSIWLTEHELEQSLSPLFMGRITDVEAAFSALSLPWDVAASVKIEVDDPVCEWNRGVFEIVSEHGKTTAQKIPGASSDVSISIQALSQAYWGAPSLERLRSAGVVLVSDELGFEALGRILPPSICFLADDF